jgi:hypothetical protein
MMRKLPVLSLAMLVVLVAAAPAPAHYRAIGKKCRDVKFAAQTDDVAGEIHKREISCKRARRIVTIVRRQRDLTPMGFLCRSRAHDPFNGLAHTDYLCWNTGNRRVSWAQY